MPLSRAPVRYIGANRDRAARKTFATSVFSAVNSGSRYVESSQPRPEWRPWSLALERASWHVARFQKGTPIEIKSTMLEHTDGQPGNFTVYSEYHEKLRRADGWYCFVVYGPHGRSGCTIVKDNMVRSSDLPLFRWHGNGGHRGTEQPKISIDSIFRTTRLDGYLTFVN
ncbi:hypothetical protein [Natronorubrum halalkaliphilum]|uniref:hypothetical protein n=1 Tax=Natronorubrum halalkaliphilum TaxID=2691917 RepID=UPI001F4439D1|nr:hypothetical protein [Natronorubrum halalkaliphilum]